MLTRIVPACLVALALAVGLANAAPSPHLLAAAQKGHKQKITVNCHEPGDAGDPALYGAWGYVFSFDHENIHLDKRVCDGANAIATDDPSVPDWQKALGALVVAHESFHQRLDLSDRLDEAKTECRAIRHFRYFVQFLGGSAELADRLVPFGLAIHWRIAARFQDYYLEACKVPWWWK